MKTLSFKKCLLIIATYFGISFLSGKIIPQSVLNNNNVIYFELLIDLLTAIIIFYLTKDELRGEFNIFKAELKDNLISIFKKTFKYWIICDLISALAAVIFLMAFNLEPSNNANSNLVNELIETNVTVMFFIAVIIGPFTEEILFRGAFFKLFSKVSDEFSVIVTSLLFALMHFFPDFFANTLSVSMIPSLIAYLALSYCITNYYYHHRNIFISFGVHGLYNFISLVLTMLII